MLNSLSGTPFIGYVSLTNGAVGPTPFTLYVNGAAYTLQALSGSVAAERIYITNITISSNDTTQALVTVDDNSTPPVKLASQYLSSTQPPGIEQLPPGIGRLAPGKVPRATASAVTAAKTVEFMIKGYISRT